MDREASRWEAVGKGWEERREGKPESVCKINETKCYLNIKGQRLGKSLYFFSF